MPPMASATMPIAGGTELLNWFRLGITAPSQVIDIGRLEDLRAIEHQGDRLTIGALATLNDDRRAHAGARLCRCAGGCLPEGRVRADPQPRDDRRQRPAKDALRLLSGRGAASLGLQQARTGHRLRGAARPQRAPCDLRLDRRLCGRPALRPAGRTGGAGCRGRAARPRGSAHSARRRPSSHAGGGGQAGGDAARLETRLQPGEIIVAYHLPDPGGPALRLCEGARTRKLRIRPRLRGGGVKL